MKDLGINKKMNPNLPTSLLIHGSNELSINVAKSLIEQGGNVIIVDQFNTQSKKYITQLKELGRADFVDFKGLEELLQKLPRVDYIFYFLQEYLISVENFSSKDFLDETGYLNITLKASKKFDSKLSLITTIKLNQDLSAHILNRNLSAPSPYSPIELQKYCETLTAENRDKLKINARIIRLGSVLGGESQNIADITVERLLNESITKPELSIYGEGLDIHYIVNISDAVYGILKLTFTDKTEGEVISLANHHDYTTLSLAYKLLEINPELTQIKFLPASDSSPVIFDQYMPALNAVEFGWNQKVQIEQTLGQAINSYNPEKGKRILEAPKKSSEEESVTEKLKKAQVQYTPIGNIFAFVSKPFTDGYKSIKNLLSGEREKIDAKRSSVLGIWIVGIISLLYFVFIPLTGMALSSYLLYANTQKALTSVVTFDFEKASSYLDKAQMNAAKNEQYLNNSEWLFNLTRQREMYDNTSQLLFASDYALSGASTLTKALVPLANYAKEFKPSIEFDSNVPSSSREYRIYLKELQTNLKGIDKATYSINIASELLSKVNVAVFPSFMQPYLTSIKMGNETIINQVLPAQEILPFLPDLLGVDKRQRYLILLQNPGEIRATGGWLSSYAVVSIEGGQIRELKVDDVYNAEGQLKIAGKNFDAPKDMQKALGLTKWSMSLSNWDPSFDNSAKTAAYFLSQLDPGSEFDAVIALDTEVVKKLLDKWNGISVPGESIPITSSNLDEKIFQLHRDFQPGDSLKATFLANLANETLKKIFSLDINGYKDIGDVIISSLNEKHILVYLDNKDAQEFFTNSGWSGELDPKYQWAPMPIEWNWGANKANLYLEKNHSLLVNINDENNVDYEYTLFTKNTSNSTIYPQGDYVNYLRIYLPRKANITSIKGFLNDRSTTYVESGYKVVAGWYNVPIKSTKSFQIKYSLIKSEDDLKFALTRNESEKNLDLWIFKQPGTKSDVYDLSVIYPESWATKKHDGLNRAINTLTSRFSLVGDKNYTITWEEK